MDVCTVARDHHPLYSTHSNTGRAEIISNKLPKSTVSSCQQECIGDTARKQGMGLGETVQAVMGVLRDGKEE